MSRPPLPSGNNQELKTEIFDLKHFFGRVMWVGFTCSLLSLAPSGFMLEVYNRVLNSRDSLTLLMLLLVAVGCYLLLEVLEWVRAEAMHRVSLHFDEKLSQRIFDAIFRVGLAQGQGNAQALSDLRTLREFVASNALMAIIDAPFILIFLALAFAIHPSLGWATIVGALSQVYLTYRAEQKTQPTLTAANRAGIAAQTYSASTLRNSQVIESMGMLGSIYERWMGHQRNMLRFQAEASDHAGLSSALSKLIQNILTSGLLGLACWLMLIGEMNGGGGMMIVASILGGKVLGPLMQIVANWRSVVNARDAYARLDQLLNAVPERETGMSLPKPEGRLQVESVIATAPGSQVPILRGVNFALAAGEALAILGPSASGKTSLARLLIGVWPAMSGKVRLDGGDIYTWNKEELGPSIGYLPQGIELFDGTLAENIARFGEIDMEQVKAATEQVGLHDFIENLPNGYESRIGDDGCFLSGGQRQRVGLARAIYGNPSFVVLDEPNSSLDEIGDKALLHTLQTLKSRKTTLIVITHRSSILPVTDKILVLKEGVVHLFGPRDEVLAALAGNKPTLQNPATA